MFGRILRLLTAPFRLLASRQARLPLLIVLGAVVGIYLLMATRSELTPIEQPEQVWPVTTVKAAYKDLRPEIELFGEVVAARSSELRPLVDGLIVEVGPDLLDGGLVERGDLLVQIDPFDYETALAEQRWMLQEARVRLEMLRKDLVRAEDLFKEKNVSEQFLELAELDVMQQEAVVGQRKIGVQRAERDLLETRLTAPYDGVVGNVNANLGKQLSTNDKVADLIDTSRLEVRFSLTNAKYGRLLDSGETIVGRPVTVSWDVGDKVLQFTGTVERVGAEIASTTGGVDAYAVMDSVGQQTDLRPGAFVRITLLDKQYVNVLEAPETALYGENIVFVVDDGRLSTRRIQIHTYSGDLMLFSSAGQPPIRDGDLIVTTQLREAGAGAKVEMR